MQPQFETVIRSYTDEKQMNRGIASMQRGGFEVVSTSTVDQGWAKGKTCCLFTLFPPLALFGRRKPRFQVTFRRARG